MAHRKAYYEKNIAYVLLLPFAQMGNLDFIQKQRQLHILDKNNEVDVEKVKKLASSMSTTKLLEYIAQSDPGIAGPASEGSCSSRCQPG